MLVVRNFQNKEDQDDFLSCIACFGYFKARKLAKHVKGCSLATKEIKDIPRQVATSRALLATTNHKYPDVHQFILSIMRRDIKYLVIKNDDSLLLYATTNIQAKEKDRYSDIKYSLRVIVELLIQFRKTSGKPNLKAKDLVLPKNYDDVLRAAKSITGYKGPRDIEKSNVFRKIGFCLSNLYVIVRSIAH